MKKFSKSVDTLAPKPVHPIAVRTHGLFGIPFVRQHMVVDTKWTPYSLTEQFKGMTDLLAKRVLAVRMAKKKDRNAIVRQHRTLRNQCRMGRTKLQMILNGSNAHAIRNFLIGDKELQRLYQSMPIHLVVDNINQRTFVMRKERDRLRYSLNQCKKKYKERLIQRASLENLVKYQDEFRLVEEMKAWELRKKIENSVVRFKAIRTINGTYKKMLQVLRYDSIFFDPIIQSLQNDIADQAQFIKHVLYLGMPAIAKFNHLREEYRVYEERVRKDLQAKLQLISQYKASEQKVGATKSPPKAHSDPLELQKRYVRETPSMLTLKNQLENIETIIKQVKMATLCSQAKEVFPRIKSQVENNLKLHKGIEKGVLGYETLEIKENRAQVFKSLLENNLTTEEIDRKEKIKELQEKIEKEDEYEKEIMNYMKNRADAYVLLKFSLWNLFEMVRYVDRPPKPTLLSYPESYLKLPLLKFEMLHMRAVPPLAFETNLDDIASSVKRKVAKLVTGVKKDLSEEELDSYMEKYHEEFINNHELGELSDEGPAEVESDAIMDARVLQGIPNRKQLKIESAKIVEELSKKED